jgi:hypothetical protein
MMIKNGQRILVHEQMYQILELLKGVAINHETRWVHS